MRLYGNKYAMVERAVRGERAGENCEESGTIYKCGLQCRATNIMEYSAGTNP
jgi:hypothetical protein